MEEKVFEIIDEEGNKKTCEKLLDFTNNDINYLIYTDYESNDNGLLNVFATRYSIINNTLKFENIETEEEWDLVQEKWSDANE